MIIASTIGIVGIIVNMLIYQQKTRTNLLLCKLSADFIWLLHYALLSAYSGAAICGVGIVREIVFLNNHRKWAKSKKWLVLFIVLSIISAIFTWKNIFSILPAAASILAIISFWIGNPRLTRIFQIPISASLLIYNVICSSYAGILNEILTLISIVIAMFYFGVKDK